MLIVVIESSDLDARSSVVHSGRRCNASCWRTLKEGQVDAGNAGQSANNSAAWGLAPGTASTILFYDKVGIEARSTLKGGVYPFVGSSNSFGKGWNLITGGR